MRNPIITKGPIQLSLFSDRILWDKKVNDQIDLLNESISKDEPLSEVLKAAGKSYDDLIYARSNKPHLRDKRYFTLEDFTEEKHNIPVVSFFSGAGGLDLGLEATGFQHSLLVESNALFCDTLRMNRPNWSVSVADVSDTEKMIELVASSINTRKKFDGLFVGGPPCQPFSIAANQRFSKNGKNFKRIGFAHKKNGNLFFDYIELIKYFQPRAFLIENVPGLIDVDGGEQIKNAYRDLESCGYTVNSPLILQSVSLKRPFSLVRPSRACRGIEAARPADRGSQSPGSWCPANSPTQHATAGHSGSTGWKRSPRKSNAVTELRPASARVTGAIL